MKSSFTQKDFFISYNKADREWADWIAGQLNAAGFSTIYQDQNFKPGHNFIIEMHRAASEARCTIAVLSPDYLSAQYTQTEWAAALVQDPTGEKGTLKLVRVKECSPSGILSPIIYIDLVGLNEVEAEQALKDGLMIEKTPKGSPTFPGKTVHSPTRKPHFPGPTPSGKPIKTLGLIPFRFGDAAPEPLSKEFKALYLHLAAVISSGQKIIFSGPDENETTIALNYQEYVSKPEIIYTKFIERVNLWSGQVDVAIVDLATRPDDFVPGRMEIHLAQAIDAIFIQNDLTKPGLFIVLLPFLPPEGEPVRKLLQQYIHAGQVTIIDSAGSFLGQSSGQLDSNYYKKMIKARGKPLDLLRYKMIRRLGHFKEDPDNPKSRCVRYYYDGSECDVELRELINDYLRKNYKGKTPLLLYYRKRTDWLVQPVMAVAEANGLRVENINLFLENPQLVESEKSISPLIVLPFVDTGGTIQTILSQWNDHKSLPKPNFLSIMSSQGDLEVNGTKKFTVNGHHQSIDYFLKMERKKLPPGDGCPMCRLGIPISNHSQEECYKFTTYDIWEMADEAGWIPEKEKEKPKGRLGLKKVPDFNEMIKKHGAWLSKKSRQLLTANIPEFPSSPILIVCPKEDAARALAEHVTFFQGFTIVKVPRKGAIDDLDEEKNNLPSLIEQWKTQGWYSQLEAANKYLPVVLIEEFSLSGGTRNALLRIVQSLGMQVLCHFSLVDFNPVESSKCGINCYSLYELQLNIDDYLAK